MWGFSCFSWRRSPLPQEKSKISDLRNRYTVYACHVLDEKFPEYSKDSFFIKREQICAVSPPPPPIFVIEDRKSLLISLDCTNTYAHHLITSSPSLHNSFHKQQTGTKHTHHNSLLTHHVIFSLKIVRTAENEILWTWTSGMHKHDDALYEWSFVH